MSNNIHLDSALAEEFTGKEAVIRKLKAENPRFKELMEQNHEIWEDINNRQNQVTAPDDTYITELERKRLVILDEIGKLIAEAE